MRHTTLASLVLTLSLSSTLAGAAPPLSAYAGQQEREIKALSAEDLKAYLSGKGMGLARAAELNGYAGPAHVLELDTPLALTPEQKAQTEALFASMERKAVVLGQALVAAERRMDRLFATQAITPDLLARSLEEIGTLQAQVRGVHLEAHLAQVAILTPAQKLRYAQLRGYDSTGVSPAHPHQPTH
ncbi:MAG: Spy/CpxP family protein refolding chaperone [Rhodoferax sp.]|nr:Spy/CpxP family protein refolding chaperone [Rhodoferax sp.]MDP3654147.1 Spy/CpxP family protein refolding chaperone [Rhodoferax sp.]